MRWKGARGGFSVGMAGWFLTIISTTFAGSRPLARVPHAGLTKPRFWGGRRGVQRRKTNFRKGSSLRIIISSNKFELKQSQIIRTGNESCTNACHTVGWWGGRGWRRERYEGALWLGKPSTSAAFSPENPISFLRKKKVENGSHNMPS